MKYMLSKLQRNAEEFNEINLHDAGVLGFPAAAFDTFAFL